MYEDDVLIQETYSINNLNQYTNLDTLNDKGKDENIVFDYDNNGNLKQDNNFKYSYDYKNRLVKTTKLNDEIVVEYKYDILGRRITKATPEKTINYVYAGNNAIEESITDIQTNTVIETKENIYSNNLDDILLTIVTNSDLTTKQLYYTKNHLNSIIAITDETGNILEEYIYDVFGKAYIRDGNSINHREFKKSSLGITRLYTGREYDEEIKLYYLRARYYNPKTGRFINRDPIDIADDVNLYGYVGNGVVMGVDLMGREKESVPYEYSIGEDISIIITESDLAQSGLNLFGLVVKGFTDGIVEQVGDDPIEIINYSTTQNVIIFGGSLLSPGKKADIGEDILTDIGSIVNGHAFKKHIDEFKEFGLETVDDLKKFADDLVNNALNKGNIKELDNGRTVIWDEKTKSVLFHDPSSKDKGTIFIHSPEKTGGQSLIDFINSK